MGVTILQPFPVQENITGPITIDYLTKRLLALGASQTGGFLVDCETFHSMPQLDGSGKKFAALPEAKHKFYYTNSCGLIYEADEVRKCIRAGKLGCDFVTHNESLTIARIQDEIRKQVGFKYPMDD